MRRYVMNEGDQDRERSTRKRTDCRVEVSRRLSIRREEPFDVFWIPLDVPHCPERRAARRQHSASPDHQRSDGTGRRPTMSMEQLESQALAKPKETVVQGKE